MRYAAKQLYSPCLLYKELAWCILTWRATLPEGKVLAHTDENHL